MNCGAELIRSLATSSPIPEGPDSDGTSGPSLFDSLGSSAPPARRRPPLASRTPAIIFGTPCGRGAHAVWGLNPFRRAGEAHASVLEDKYRTGALLQCHRCVSRLGTLYPGRRFSPRLP